MIFQITPYGGGYFQNAFYYLEQWGIIDVLLPFVLIFAILFAILQQVAIFKSEDKLKPNKKINSIIALVIALLVVIPHITGRYPAESDPINIINNFLPGTAIIFVVILMALLLIGFVGGELPTAASLWIGAIALLALIFVFLKALNPTWFPLLNFLNDPALQTTIIVILIFGLVFWFVTKEPSTGGKESLIDWLFKKRGGPKSE